MICLCYLPKAGRLTITIIKGHNLRAMDITGKSGRLIVVQNRLKFTIFILPDPYVKVYLICQGKRIRKKNQREI